MAISRVRRLKRRDHRIHGTTASVAAASRTTQSGNPTITYDPDISVQRLKAQLLSKLYPLGDQERNPTPQCGSNFLVLLAVDTPKPPRSESICKCCPEIWKP